jgi:hypothetical protein
MLRSEALAEFLDDWEAEHGAFTEEELASDPDDLSKLAEAADCRALIVAC